MKPFDLNAFSEGTSLITAPHMDDAVLACGGLLLKTPRKDNIHILYVGDGRGMGGPAKSGNHKDDKSDLNTIRKQETRKALDILGIPQERVHFLDLPDWRFKQHQKILEERLRGIWEDIRPDCVFTPFRYDRHTDHVTLNHLVRKIAADREKPCRVLEYFVYYQWKLLPNSDIRQCHNPEYLYEVNLGPASSRKKDALMCFETQVTKYFPWQHKPALSASLVNEFAGGPEIFLDAGRQRSERDIFTLSPRLVRCLHLIEPRLKYAKEKLLIGMHTLLNHIRPRKASDGEDVS